jgi:transposase
MPTATTRPTDPVPAPTLHLALDLGNTTWQLAFAAGLAHAPRLRTVPARDVPALVIEIAAAKRRFGLPADVRVVSCYEAGRDGFWIHRALHAQGIANTVVDAASIEVNRRQRQAKSDRLDARALVRLRIRHTAGERGVWHVVHVPSVEAEDARHLHRELFALTRQRTRQVTRIKSLLALHGVVLPRPRGVPARMPTLLGWDARPLPAGVAARLTREWTRLRALQRDIRALERERADALAAPEAPADPVRRMVARLRALRGIGDVSAWLYTTEFFGWRQFHNRREVAALAGLTPTTRASGAVAHELGISKAGNALIRALAIELAWSWVRRQPTSALTRWYRARFASGGARQRRIGIVAVARKLLIALWRYLETDQLPEGAVLKRSPRGMRVCICWCVVPAAAPGPGRASLPVGRAPAPVVQKGPRAEG